MKDLLRFTTIGSVDDGKSTLIGRLLFETNKVPQDQYDAIVESSKKRGKEDVDLSLLLDGLESEREQGITIDVSYRFFETEKRKFIVADTPGHEQYTRNMVTGASTADLAIILIDAKHGVQIQSKRHGFINSLLGVKYLLVTINKMDLVNYSEDVYNKIVSEYSQFCEKLVCDPIFVPISALKGDNVVSSSKNMKWYNGSTVLHLLENIKINKENNYDFRFPVQTVLRPNLNHRSFAGKIYSGSIKVNEEILVLPSKKKANIKDIISYNENKEKANKNESISLVLDKEIDISRGDMIVRPNNIPMISNNFQAIICWMDEENMKNKSYIIKHTTKTTKCFIDQIYYKFNINTLSREKNVDEFKLNDLGKVSIYTTKPLFFDLYKLNKETGSFILIDPDTNNTVACGMIKNYMEIDNESKSEYNLKIKTDFEGLNKLEDFLQKSKIEYNLFNKNMS